MRHAVVFSRIESHRTSHLPVPWFTCVRILLLVAVVGACGMSRAAPEPADPVAQTAGTPAAEQAPAAPTPTNSAVPSAPSLACKRDAAADKALDALRNASSTIPPIRLASRFKFLPLDTEADILAFTPFDPAIRYRAIWTVEGEKGSEPHPIDSDQVWAEEATIGPAGTDFKQLEDKNHKTMIHFVPVADESWFHWQKIRVYVVGCTSADVPRQYGQFEANVTTLWFCRVLAGLLCFAFYALAAFGTFYIHRAQRVYKSIDKPAKHGLYGTNYASLLHHFNPVVLTAGSNGRGSATKLQILFFSMVVFGLVSYVWMSTGYLSDLSSTILLLMGISGLGATVSAATDVAKTRLDFDNWAWLINRHWLPKGGVAEANRAQWKDIVMTEGEFDVYRFQMVIFSVLVGLALLGAGGKMAELSTFTIPGAFLGILGLSQVVYVAGKLVAPPTIPQLNEQIAKLRDAESALRTGLTRREQASANTDLLALPLDRAELVARVGDLYDKYIEIWETTRTMFESVLSRDVSAAAEGYRPPFPYLSPPMDVKTILEARYLEAKCKGAKKVAALSNEPERAKKIQTALDAFEALWSSVSAEISNFENAKKNVDQLTELSGDEADTRFRLLASSEVKVRNALDQMRQRLDQFDRLLDLD